MVDLKAKYRVAKVEALDTLYNHRYYKNKLSKRSKVRYNQNITKFFNETKKHPNYVKQEDIEDYIDNYRVGKDKNRKPKYDTINVIKNAILCYYNRIL